jgi:Tfp pilus assembly protein PilO
MDSTQNMTQKISNVKPVLLLVAATALFGWYALFPAQSRLGEVRAEEAAIRGKIDSQMAALSTLEPLSREVAELREQVARFGLLIPRQPMVGEFSTIVQGILEKQGLRNPLVQARQEFDVGVDRVPAGVLAQLPGLRGKSFEIHCDQANYEAVFASLSEIEKLPRLSHIHELTLRIDDKNQQHVSFELYIDIFWLPEQPDMAQERAP